MTENEIAAAMRAWELKEADRRKRDPRYEDKQEMAERAIMLGFGYGDDAADARASRKKK